MIEFLGGATAISVTIGYLGKKSIEAFLSGRVEAYKKNLEKVAYEHSVKFQHLHAERAESIKNVYEKLVILDEAIHSTLRQFQRADEPSLEDKIKTLAEAFNSFRDYFIPRRIFFEEGICEIVESIIDAARGVFIDITTLPVDPGSVEYEVNRGLLTERHEFWEKARKLHSREIKKLKDCLEEKFRLMLGINA